MMERFRIGARRGGARRLTDAAVAAAVTGVSLAMSDAAGSWHPGRAPNLAGYLLVAAGGVSLATRRRYPAAVLAVTLAAGLLAGPVGHAEGGWLPLIVAFLTAVLARRRAAAVASLVIGYLVSVWPPWLIGTSGHTSATSALGLLSGLLFLLAVAEALRAASQRRLAAERIRQQELLRRAGEERMRIARDLHDVVAHNISVINVQANTALHLMDRQPERARQALATINDVSRQALGELRSVLGVLRGADDGAAAPRAPAPGLARLGELAAMMAAAGLKVAVETEGDPVRLPASADLAAYRIVQEALTNSARHSGGTRAVVRVRYRAGEVEVEVDDDGASGARPPGSAGTGSPGTGSPGTGSPGTGSGIAGMAERAQALGGWLRAGPRPGGGFRVTARLPAGDGSRT